MSMSIVLGNFTKISEEKLNAEYSELCKSVYITEYMDEIITEFLEDLKVFEITNEMESEEIIYKSVSISKIHDLSIKIDDLLKEYFHKYESIKGLSEKNDIVQHIRNLVELNYMIKEYLLNISKITNNNSIYLIVA